MSSMETTGQAEAQICIADPAAGAPAPDRLVCELPVTTTGEAADFLEILGSGGSLGAGMRTTWIGQTMPAIRSEYERLIREFVTEIERRQRAGVPARELARWAVAERRRIANRMRWRSGPGVRVLFEIRDWHEYGPGGRTFQNIESRYQARGYRGDALNQRMIQGAKSPNTGISKTAIKGARYLRHGGRVVVVFSLVSTAYVLMTTPEDQMEQVLYQEVGGFAGGSIGAGTGVAVCLVFGIATGGWGLLACAAVGGVAGGAIGTHAGDRLYYSRRPGIEEQAARTGVISAHDLTESIDDAFMSMP